MSGNLVDMSFKALDNCSSFKEKSGSTFVLEKIVFNAVKLFSKALLDLPILYALIKAVSKSKWISRADKGMLVS